ncbi:MAG: hypothetical protein IPF54_21715 [Draconibacterium sp.]|nr:hypothetical protein [Draconibacterium sp.]
MEKSRLRTPIIYNYSFAIELIVKGILIKSEPDSYITKEGSINFSHKTIIKGINSLNIIWEDNENVIINNLIDYVTFGKYPAKTKVPTMQEMIDNLKPFDLHWNWTYVDIIKSFKALDSIYLKLNEKYIEKL